MSTKLEHSRSNSNKTNQLVLAKLEHYKSNSNKTSQLCNIYVLNFDLCDLEKEVKSKTRVLAPFEPAVPATIWPATKLTAWKCDVIESIFLAVPPPDGSGWRLM
jgi:hypothetical protein